jgi:hypothetical protein
MALTYNLMGKDSYGEINMDEIKTRISHCLFATEMELERLRSYPELFPSTAVKIAFDHDVGIIFSDGLKYNSTELLEARESEKKKLLDSVFEAIGGPAHPSQDEARRPWQQFLHNGAPGARLNQSLLREGESNQLLTHAGLRIVEAWTLGYRQIYLDVQKVNYVHNISQAVIPSF